MPFVINTGGSINYVFATLDKASAFADAANPGRRARGLPDLKPLKECKFSELKDAQHFAFLDTEGHEWLWCEKLGSTVGRVIKTKVLHEIEPNRLVQAETLGVWE